ncbi:hypothetical protein QZH41_010163 [Actinostola sp. cb2023]|nr:hypothetical protein QZH41_010163 [Actinostola sp. cb2023]
MYGLFGRTESHSTIHSRGSLDPGMSSSVPPADNIQLEPGTNRFRCCWYCTSLPQWPMGNSVCHNIFDMNDAKVACRQLGFSKAVGYWRYGRGSGKVWLNWMACSGSETSLHSCTHDGWGNHGSTCDSHKYDVGVVFGTMRTKGRKNGRKQGRRKESRLNGD